MNQLMNWYHSQTERDQVILQIAAPLVVVLLLCILLNSSYQNLRSQQQHNQQLLNDYQWLRTEARPLNLWRADFGKRSLGQLNSNAELGSLLNSGLSKYNIRGRVSPKNNGSWQVNINPSDGNRVLSFIEAAIGSGASPSQVKLTRADSKGLVSGMLVLTPVMEG